MSNFRGFDSYLTSRVDRAQGDHFYFKPDTLRFFDAYGGAQYVLPSKYDGKDEPRRFYAVVESIRDDYSGGPRGYRPVFVLFTDAGPAARESVEVIRPYENVATAGTAQRLARKHLAAMSQAMEDGATLDDVARNTVV